MILLSAPGFGVVGSGAVPLDDVRPGAPHAQGVCEFALDAGDRCVEYGFGLCAEGFHFVFTEAGFVIKGFLGIEFTELFPVGNQVVCRDAFRVGEIQTEKGTFGRVEVNPCGRLLGTPVTFLRQQEIALSAALNDGFMKCPAHFFCKVRQPVPEIKAITSL